MKQKLVLVEDWRRLILPNSGLSFSTVSPVTVINGPFFAYAWAGIGSVVSGASIPWGTVVGCRLDQGDSKPLNLNYWYLNSTVTPSLLVLQDLTDKSKIPEHWVGGIPSIFGSAPPAIKDLIMTQQKEI